MQQIHSPEILLEYTCLITQLYGSNPAHLGWRHGQGELRDGEDTLNFEAGDQQQRITLSATSAS